MRGDPEVIGPKWAIRFRDLSGWHRVRCKCFACSHVAELMPEQLKQLQLRRLLRKFRSMKPDTQTMRRDLDESRVADLEELLRCTRCGNRINNTLRVVKLPRNT
jgi:formate dehydrogenase maturation protein FdhE